MPEPSARPTSIDGQAPGIAGRRLPFIDGVRGMAAFVVLVGHLMFILPTMQPSRHGVGWLFAPFWLGNEMVLLFILVSGFALYYSEVTRRARGREATTSGQFAGRRAWRVAPVYYVAMSLGLATWPATRLVTLRPANGLAQVLTPGGTVAHLFFVHNLRITWAFQINGPLWSIAYEVQLYLLFPALFWAMRRWNPLLVAVVVVVPIELVNKYGHLSFPVFGLARWFVAGCLLAELGSRGFRVPVWVSLPIGGLAAFLGVVGQTRWFGSTERHDAVWLVAFVFLVLAMMEAPASRRNPMTLPVMRWLGVRSYSLYALHWPGMMLIILASQHLDLTGGDAAAFVTLIGVPAALILAAVSFRFVEHPSLERMRRVGAPSGAELPVTSQHPDTHEAGP